MLTPLVALHALAVAAAAIPLPAAPPIGTDYLVYDAAHHRVWIPAGNTGHVFVVDVPSGKVTASEQPTAQSPRAGRPPVGPSSATVGDRVVWVGNRADHRVCAFDAVTLARGACVTLPSMPDGVQYVAATHELWVTTPRDQTLTIVDVAAKEPRVAGSVKLPGDPEGYALDGGHFYTNLEDKDRTVTVDIRTRKVVSDWPAGCGGEGPRGIAVDGARHLVLVACTDGLSVLDAAHGGKSLARLRTGSGGVDNIDYDAARRTVWVASRDAASIAVVRVGDDGKLDLTATLPTAHGARNAVVDEAGTAYVVDGAGARLLVRPLPAK